MKHKITKYDIILIVAVLIISMFCLFMSANETFDRFNKSVKIYVNNELYKEYTLTNELYEEIRIGDDEHYNLVVIKKGTVFVIDSSCPDKICEKHNPISKSGEMIVCLPNKVVVRIEGTNDETELDSINQ